MSYQVLSVISLHSFSKFTSNAGQNVSLLDTRSAKLVVLVACNHGQSNPAGQVFAAVNIKEETKISLSAPAYS